MVIKISILNGDSPLNETVRKIHNINMPVSSFHGSDMPSFCRLYYDVHIL
jgi:hypothetical protein